MNREKMIKMTCKYVIVFSHSLWSNKKVPGVGFEPATCFFARQNYMYIIYVSELVM